LSRKTGGALVPRLLKRCQKSPIFFVSNFCKVKHPKAGIIPFNLFNYQRRSLQMYLKNRYNIYRKCRQCFVAGTMVWTPSGPKAIETLQPGDLVYTVTEGRVTTAPVKEVYDNGLADDLMEVCTETGHRSVCTADHEFLTEGDWKSVSGLVRDDVLVEVSRETLSFVKGAVKSVRPLDRTDRVFDLNVPSSHNYIVDGAVVHNCGISTLTGAFALWYAMFFSNKKVLIVSKRDEDAKEFLKKNVKFVYDHLPRLYKDIYGDPPDLYNEHSVGFSNGSVIKSLTSSKDTMRSESASLNIIDEAAFMPSMDDMWAGAQPCCAYGTVVSTGRGLKRIDKMLEEAGSPGAKTYAPQDIVLPTDAGPQSSNAIWNNGYCRTIRIRTSLGYEFEATSRHRIKVLDEDYAWKRLSCVQNGNLACLMLNTCVGEPVSLADPEPALVCLDGCSDKDQIDVSCKRCHKSFTRRVVSLRRFRDDSGHYVCPSCAHHGDFVPPERMTEELAEILGYYVGDGWLSEKRPKRIKLSCDPGYGDLPRKLVDRYAKVGVSSYIEPGHDTLEVRVNNASFVDWLVRQGLNSKTNAFDAQIPAPVLASGPQILCAFLRGLFEADGTITGGRISLSTSSATLADQVRTSLLSLGILTHTSVTRSGGFEGSSGGYVIGVLDRRNCQRFQNKIGFLSNGKNSVVLQDPKQENGLCIEHPVVEELCDAALRTTTDKKQRARIYGYRRTCRIPYQRALEISDGTTKLGRLLDKGLVFDKIVSIENDSTLTADLSVPTNNTYIANGFVSHNTLIHGGSVVVISTVNGVGNWYHTTWEDAASKSNEFNPIEIMWWDMDWAIEYRDDFTGEVNRICPTDGIRECVTKGEREKWGPYWSPWLEEQYRALQQKGESHKFRQEVLAEFIGTGQTVVPRDVLVHLDTAVSDKYFIAEPVPYIHPTTGARHILDFQRQLRIWKPPVKPEPDVMENGRIIRPGASGHAYSVGVDISSGEASDYSAIVVVDCNTLEQVAEMLIRVLPTTLVMMIDYIGRWYNNSFCVPERTGIGQPICTSLYNDFAYSNIFRMPMPSGRPSRKVGFPTSPVHKPMLNKALMDYLGEDGVTVLSKRIVEQLHIYVHLGSKRTGCVEGPGNHDDLTIALALACVGIKNASIADPSSLVPMQANKSEDEPLLTAGDTARMGRMLQAGGAQAMLPLIPGGGAETAMPGDELRRFAASMGGITMSSEQVPFLQRKAKQVKFDQAVRPVIRRPSR